MGWTRQLMIMRHAKAEAFAASDHARELTDRGRRDAQQAGAWARECGHLPDLVLCSSAARTRQTWDWFARGSGSTLEALFDRSLYAADTDSALEAVRAADADAARVLLIGHNPTMAALVHTLEDGGGPMRIFAEISAGYPTAALTVLDVGVPWADLDAGGARIRDFHVGRG